MADSNKVREIVFGKHHIVSAEGHFLVIGLAVERDLNHMASSSLGNLHMQFTKVSFCRLYQRSTCWQGHQNLFICVTSIHQVVIFFIQGEGYHRLLLLQQ